MSIDFGVIEDMKKLGLNEYESKAYLKLLEDYPVNGYTLSKNSGIPRSRIYEVLKNLKDKQLVFEQEEDKGSIYYPLEPKLLVDKLKDDFNNALDNINNFATKIYSEKNEENKLVVIRGRKEIIEFINRLIKDAEKSISVSIWEEELSELSEALNKAIAKGITLKGIYFGKNNSYKQLVPHRRIETYLAEKNERYITIIIDGIHVVSGMVARGEDSTVTWTKDKGFVDMSEDYIFHDLMINMYSNKLEGKAKEHFENFLDNIRKEYFDFS
ncbi:TrmB family transcriptional regulator [Clostridium grantii]|uniref:Transcriptional regulator TrmB n=1 Tax=Clostridium grantii DSM 8605 TaxID=1121316 RepID=A0A1M5V743_9CLOT|nr:helix-turn-helix domain-containing protein [Clostridium grantii]SHH71045.1 transcriptional regulator TrmB [Clostridium grantii DSM 8605]